MISVSVIIPVYNEESTILEILNKFISIRKKINLELVVVNDGSTDNTKFILDNNINLYDKVLHYNQNMGKGKAIIQGLSNSINDFIYFQDADLEYNPNDLFLFTMEQSITKADFIMGSRFSKENLKTLPFFSVLGNRLVTNLFNIINHTSFSDICCCTCLFKRNILPINKIKSYSWGQHLEILTYVNANSQLKKEIFVSYDGRSFSSGKKIRYWDVFEIIYQIIKTKIKIFIN